jgi:hypothetical protein
MAVTLFDRMRQEGRQEGLLEGQRQLLLIQLEARFGPLGQRVREQVYSLPVERLGELGRTVLTAASLRELGLEG